MPRDPLLNEDELTRRLLAIPEWKRETTHVVRTVECPTFMEAMALVQRVALMAEVADHHPDIDIRYRKVRFDLTTHDSGGLTWRDLDLAETIERQLVNAP
jgi:4a-hydroxytetrahydrobiopterin dehydratase